MTTDYVSVITNGPDELRKAFDAEPSEVFTYICPSPSEYEGYSTLHLAAALGQPQCVEMLLDAKMDANLLVSDHCKSSGLTEAAHQAQDRFAGHPFTQWGFTPLCAITRGSKASDECAQEIVQLLIKRKASLHQPRPDCPSPVHLAAYASSVPLCQLLLQLHADVSAVWHVDSNGPCDFVACGTSYRHDDSGAAILNAAQLLQIGKTVKPQSTEHNHADDAAATLIEESVSKTPSTLGLLAQVKAATCADEMLRSKQVDKLSAMLSQYKHHCADGSATDADGLNALHWAALLGNVTVAQLLLDANMDINIKTISNEPMKDGKTALHLASLSGATATVKLLVTQKADVNATSISHPCTNITALHEAALGGHYHTVKFLLNARAEADIRKVSAYGNPLESCTDGAFNPQTGALLGNFWAQVERTKEKYDGLDCTKESWLNTSAALVVHQAAHGGTGEEVEELILKGKPDEPLASLKEYLWVTVTSCAGLKDLEITSTSDPFVKVILKQPNGKVQEFKTAAKDGELNPRYVETFEFEMTEAMRTAGVHEATLTFEVWDDNNVSDDLMGQISYRMSELNVSPDSEGECFTDALKGGEGSDAGDDFGTLTSMMACETAEHRAERINTVSGVTLWQHRFWFISGIDYSAAVLSVLAAHGADIDPKIKLHGEHTLFCWLGGRAYTPLLNAVLEDNYEAARLLIALGADTTEVAAACAKECVMECVLTEGLDGLGMAITAAETGLGFAVTGFNEMPIRDGQRSNNPAECATPAIKLNDCIVQADGSYLSTLEQFRHLLKGSGEQVTLTVSRQHSKRCMELFECSQAERVANNDAAILAHPAAFNLAQVLDVKVNRKYSQADQAGTFSLLQAAWDKAFTLEEVKQAASSDPDRLKEMLTSDPNRVASVRDPLFSKHGESAGCLEQGTALNWAVEAGCVQAVDVLLNDYEWLGSSDVDLVSGMYNSSGEGKWNDLHSTMKAITGECVISMRLTGRTGYSHSSCTKYKSSTDGKWYDINTWEHYKGQRVFSAALQWLRPSSEQQIKPSATPGQISCIKRLLDAKADLRAVIKDEKRDLHEANYPTEVQALLQAAYDHGFTEQDVKQAAASDLQWLQRMLQMDRDRVISASPLHSAAQAGFVEGIQLLLDSKIDTDVLNQDGNTALSCAVVAHGMQHACNIKEAVMFLIAAKADANADSSSPSIHAATASGNTEMVSILVDAKVDLDLLDEDGYGRSALIAPLLHAFEGQHFVDTVDLLLKLKVDLELPDEVGNTALHHAVSLAKSHNASMQTVKTLLKAKANLDATGKDGWTPLFVAADQGANEVVKLLLLANANLDIVSEEGQVVTQVAKASKSTAHMLNEAMRYKREGRKWTGVDWTSQVVQQALRQLAQAIKAGRSLFGSDIKVELMDAFKKIDRDSDSSVDRAELKTALTRLGIFVDDKIMGALFTELDADGNGTVCVEELASGLQQACKSVSSPSKTDVQSSNETPHNSPAKKQATPKEDRSAQRWVVQQQLKSGGIQEQDWRPLGKGVPFAAREDAEAYLEQYKHQFSAMATAFCYDIRQEGAAAQQPNQLPNAGSSVVDWSMHLLPSLQWPTVYSVFFEQGNAQFSLDEADAVLSKVAQWVLLNPNVQMLIRGHCAQHPDKSESFLRADQLSRTRATNVAAFLQLRGAPIKQILRPAAHGTSHPFSQNEDDGGRQYNRRVDVIVVVDPNGDLVPVSPANSPGKHLQAPPVRETLNQMEGHTAEGRRRALQVMVLLGVHTERACWDSMSSFESKEAMIALANTHCADCRGRLSNHELGTLLEELSCNTQMPVDELDEFCRVVGVSGMPGYAQPVGELLWAFRAMCSIARRALNRIEEMEKQSFDAGLAAAVEVLGQRMGGVEFIFPRTANHESDCVFPRLVTVSSPRLVKMALEALCVKVSKTEAWALFDVLAKCGVDGQATVDISNFSNQIIALMKPTRSRGGRLRKEAARSRRSCSPRSGSPSAMRSPSLVSSSKSRPRSASRRKKSGHTRRLAGHTAAEMRTIVNRQMHSESRSPSPPRRARSHGSNKSSDVPSRRRGQSVSPSNGRSNGDSGSSDNGNASRLSPNAIDYWSSRTDVYGVSQYCDPLWTLDQVHQWELDNYCF